MWKFEFWPNLKTETEPRNHKFNSIKDWKYIQLFRLSLILMIQFRWLVVEFKFQNFITVWVSHSWIKPNGCQLLSKILIYLIFILFHPFRIVSCYSKDGLLRYIDSCHGSMLDCKLAYTCLINGLLN